jgi:hypothetical protein
MDTIGTRLELGYSWEAFLRIQKSESIFFDSQWSPSPHSSWVIQVAFAVSPFGPEETGKVGWALARSPILTGCLSHLFEDWTLVRDPVLICPQQPRA